MNVSYPEFEVFYEELRAAFFKNELGNVLPTNARGISSPKIWEHVITKENGTKVKAYVELFAGNDTATSTYFYDKNEQVKSFKKAKIDDLSYFKALRYLKFYQPENLSEWNDKHWGEQLEILHQDFIQKNQKEIERRKKKVRQATVSAAHISEYSDYFIAVHEQGKRLDRTILMMSSTDYDQLEIGKIVTGEIQVFFQDENGKYPQIPEKIKITGYLIHGILTFAFANYDRKHTGVMMLEQDSSGNFNGDYLVYFLPIPNGRKQEKELAEDKGWGKITYIKSTREDAEKFLNEVKGDENAPERVNFAQIEM